MSRKTNAFGNVTLKKDPRRELRKLFARRMATREDAIRSLLGGSFCPLLMARFDIDKVLGHGAFGTVFLASDKATKVPSALKAIQKSKVTCQESLQNEIDALRLCKHRNITDLLATFEDGQYLYVVLEFCAGGELLDLMCEVGPLSSPVAAYAMREIFHGVEYIHSRGVVHRDLKPDNVLLVARGDLFQGLRIADFGIIHIFPDFDQSRSELHTSLTSPLTTTPPAHKITGGENMGTLEYMAPEMLMHEDYDFSVDMWACGVILYNLLSGSYPFSGSTALETARLIVNAREVDLSHPGWKGVPDEAKDMLARLMCPQVANRLSATQALVHPLMQTVATCMDPQPEQ